MIAISFKSPAIVLTLFLMLAACDQKSDEAAQADGSGQSTTSDADANGGPNVDASRQAAIDELSDQSYEDVRGSTDCTDDCSGHNAGFEWAKVREIWDPDLCSGNSDSFISGCKAYGEEIESRTDDTNP